MIHRFLRVPLLLLAGLIASPSSQAESVHITLMHTNDLHSHFRPEKTSLGLGGVARLKTAIDRIRRENTQSLLIDGGDWSEGNIYYNLGAGTESLRMMSHLGYDIAVIGNHDGLNGPDNLIKSYRDSGSRLKLLAANVDYSKYARAEEFSQTVLPYTIKNFGKVKVAFIGLVTYEFIYDRFMQPVEFNEPISKARKLSRELKEQHGVDAVVVVSHNRIGVNEAILRAAPQVDLVIGAHDHIKLTKPIVVKRAGKPDAWVVETGFWGRYLGRVDLTVTPHAEAQARGQNPVSLDRYELTQMDRRIPQDPDTLTRVERLESEIEHQYGAPVFHDHVADNQLELDGTGVESRSGMVVTDAYMHAVKADFAIDQVKMIPGEIHPGVITTADIINLLTLVYNPSTGKQWTLKTFPLKGRILKIALNLVFASKKFASMGLASSRKTNMISFSGLKFSYSPIFQSQPLFFNPAVGSSIPAPRAPNGGRFWEAGYWDRADDDDNFVIHNLMVNGEPLDEDKIYTVAAGDGIIYAIEFINKNFLHNLIPIDKAVDTGIEDWQVVKSYLNALSPITSSKVQLGERVRSDGPDLAILPEDVLWSPSRKTAQGMEATVRVTVRNLGASASKGEPALVHLYTNQHGIDETVEPAYVELSKPLKIRVLQPGESQSFQWDVNIPRSQGYYPLVASIDGNPEEVNHTNDQVSHYFSASHRVNSKLRFK